MNSLPIVVVVEGAAGLVSKSPRTTRGKNNASFATRECENVVARPSSSSSLYKFPSASFLAAHSRDSVSSPGGGRRFFQSERRWSPLIILFLARARSRGHLFTGSARGLLRFAVCRQTYPACRDGVVYPSSTPERSSVNRAARNRTTVVRVVYIRLESW